MSSSQVFTRAYNLYAKKFQKLTVVPIQWDLKRKELRYEARTRVIISWTLSMIFTWGIVYTAGGTLGVAIVLLKGSHFEYPFVNSMVLGVVVLFGGFAAGCHFIFHSFGKDFVLVFNT